MKDSIGTHFKKGDKVALVIIIILMIVLGLLAYGITMLRNHQCKKQYGEDWHLNQDIDGNICVNDISKIVQ